MAFFKDFDLLYKVGTEVGAMQGIEESSHLFSDGCELPVLLHNRFLQLNLILFGIHAFKRRGQHKTLL